MANGDIAIRWARDEVRALAKRFFEQAHSPPCEKQCEDHADVARALGFILTGLDTMMDDRRLSLAKVRNLVAISIPLAGVFAGIAFGVGKLLGV